MTSRSATPLSGHSATAPSIYVVRASVELRVLLCRHEVNALDRKVSVRVSNIAELAELRQRL